MLELTSLSVQQINKKPTVNSENSLLGLIIALSVIGLWAFSLVLLLSLNLSQVNVFLVIPAILWQTFLYTGLFITAHDAMHGVIFPQNHKLNNLVGTVAVLLYALFYYKKLVQKHWLHHKHPATQFDPDFHDSKHENFFAWYFNFMKGYWSWKQLLGLMIIFNVASRLLHIPEINLTYFWVIPSILSSVQLFFFGTFIPHREPKAGYTNIHRAESNYLPVFWSFITCYHFGYHKEHHQYPHLPWWKLPEIYRMHKKVS